MCVVPHFIKLSKAKGLADGLAGLVSRGLEVVGLGVDGLEAEDLAAKGLAAEDLWVEDLTAEGILADGLEADRLARAHVTLLSDEWACGDSYHESGRNVRTRYALSGRWSYKKELERLFICSAAIFSRCKSKGTNEQKIKSKLG